MSGFMVVLRLATMLLVSALAIIGCLLVLGVFEDAVIKDALIKTVSVIGILTVSSLAMVVLSSMGVKKDESSNRDDRE